MYGAEQRMKAVETFARFGCSAADTIAELGYPTRHTLRNWWREYQIGGEGFLERKRREPKYSDEEKRGAVDYYLECLCQAGNEQSGTRNLSSLADGLVKRSPFRASAVFDSFYF